MGKLLTQARFTALRLVLAVTTLAAILPAGARLLAEKSRSSARSQSQLPSTTTLHMAAHAAAACLGSAVLVSTPCATCATIMGPMMPRMRVKMATTSG
jgi:hypothetical protein